MIRHRFKPVLILTVACSLLVPAIARAQGKSSTNQGSTPNGKPFQMIQSQIGGINAQLSTLTADVVALQQQVAALDSRVTSVVNDLQSQLNALAVRVAEAEARLTVNEGAIATLADATAALEARISAAETSIQALQASNASLQATLADVQAQLAAETSSIRAALLQLENNLRTLINTNTANIAALQGQVSGIQMFMSNMVNSACVTGQAARAISPNGVLVCTSAAAPGTNLFTVSSYLTAPAYWSVGGALGCPTGSTYVDGGFEHWPYYENRSTWASDLVSYASLYVTGYNYATYYDGWSWYTVAIPYYGIYHNTYDYGRYIYTPFTSSMVTRSLPSAGTYYYALQNQGSWSTSMTVQVTCRHN